MRCDGEVMGGGGAGGPGRVWGWLRWRVCSGVQGDAGVGVQGA